MPIVQSGLIGYWNAKQGLAGTSWQNIAPTTTGKYNAALTSVTIVSGQYATLNGTSSLIDVGAIQAANKGTAWEIEMYLNSPFDNTGGDNSAAGYLYAAICVAPTDISKLSMVGLVRDGSGYALASEAKYAYTFPKNTLIKINFSVSAGGQETLYINDTQVKQETNAGFSNLDYVRFGAFADGGYHFKGSMYSIKLYNRILTSAERTQNTGIGVEVGLDSSVSASVSAITANASASAIAPVITTGSSISATVNSPVATATASAIIPTISAGNPSIKSLVIYAHEDDELGGMNTDLYYDIRNAGTLGTVFGVIFTGNTDGTDRQMQGAQVAWSYMAGRTNSWTSENITINSKVIKTYRLNGTNIRLANMMFPDGLFDGSNPITMEKLWNNQISSISTLDSGIVYTRNDIIQCIAGLIDFFSINTLRHLYHLGTFGDGLEHSDHHAMGKFSNEGAKAATNKPSTIVAYRADSIEQAGYTTLSAGDATIKGNVLDAYAPYGDPYLLSWRSDPDIVFDMGHIWRYSYTITTNIDVTITSIIANANANGLAPTITVQKQISVQSVTANAQASALSPNISTSTSVSTTISAVVASANAGAGIPTIDAKRNVNVIATIANATASAIVPNVVSGPLSVQIIAVVASALAEMLNPTVTIKQEIVKRLSLTGNQGMSISLHGSLSPSISLNGNSTQTHLKGGIQ